MGKGAYLRTLCLGGVLAVLAAPCLAQTSSAVPGVVTPSTTAAATAPADPSAAGFTPPPAAGTSDLTDTIPGLIGTEGKLRTAEAPPSPDESLIFTPWEHALLAEAKRGYSTKSGGTGIVDAKAPSIREIGVGGILYRTPTDWTVYLNNQRITPATLPPQVVDLEVTPQTVRLKWFDVQNNLIYPVVLRANQRFNLDARIFLPGVPNALTVVKTP